MQKIVPFLLTLALLWTGCAPGTDRAGLGSRLAGDVSATSAPATPGQALEAPPLELAATSPSRRAKALEARVKALVARYPGMKAGVSIVHIPSGERVDVDGDRPYPLASVFKLPIMIEVARQIQAGEKGLTLDRQLVLRDPDKVIGSGRLQDKPAGSKVSLRQAVELMETVSDNTATDMVFDVIGVDSVNRLMKSLGLHESDIYLKNRPAWLVSLGMGSQFRGLGPRQIASKWLSMSSAQRHEAARKIEAENRGLSLSRFQAAEDASAAKQTHAENVLVAAAVDNMGSPSDFAELLAKLWQGRILDEEWTDYCLGVLARQKFNTRIPRNLPAGTVVYHKTGTIAGVVNDAGIMEVTPEDPVAIAVFVRDVQSGRQEAAQELIGRIARAAYDAYR